MDFNKEKEYLENRNFLFNLSDAELINKIIEDKYHIAVIFEKYKDDFPKELTKKFPGIDYPTIEDVFTDSVLDLYDKIMTRGITILERERSSIAGYLMGIYKNKLTNENKKYGSKLSRTDFENQNNDNYYNAGSEQSQYYDQDDFIMEQDLLYNQICLQYEVLQIMKNKGGKCYSLILLSLSSEYNYQVPNLTELFNYSNNQNTANQLYKCKERFKRIYNNFQLV